MRGDAAVWERLGLGRIGLERVAAMAVMELRSTARGATPFVLRTALAGFTAAFFIFAVFSAYQHQSNVLHFQNARRVAAEIFAATYVVRVLIIVVLGILAGIESVRRERREQTLGLLLLSRFRPWEVVAGKSLAATAFLLMILAATLPVDALISWMGGVDPDWLPLLAAYYLCAAWLAATLGIVCAAATAQPQLPGYGAGAVVLVVLWVFAVDPASSWASWIGAPAHGVVLILDQNPETAAHLLRILGGMTLAAAALAVVAGGLLPRRRKTSDRLHRLFETPLRKAEAAEPDLKPRETHESGRDRDEEERCLEDPLVWAADRRMRKNPVLVLRYGNALAVAAFAAGWMVDASGVFIWLSAANFLSVYLFALIAAVSGASVWTSERRQGTLRSLLATPLSARRIVLGKARVSLKTLGYLTLAYAMFLIPSLIRDPVWGKILLTQLVEFVGVFLFCFFAAMRLALTRDQTTVIVLGTLIGSVLAIFFVETFAVQLLTGAFYDFGGMIYSPNLFLLIDLLTPWALAGLAFSFLIRDFDRLTGRAG